MRLTLFAIAALITLVTYSQKKFKVIDTLKLDGVVYELGTTSLAELNIDIKRNSYVDVVKSAQRQGWGLCPTDSLSIKRIASKVSLDPNNHKYSVYIATAPFSIPEALRLENAFWIHEISANSSELGYGIREETVGYFGMEEFPEIFPPLREVMVPGFWMVGEKPVMYDWVFMRKKVGVI